LIHQDVMNNLSKEPNIWKTVCSSCKNIGFFWDENKKYKTGGQISILMWASRLNTICDKCGRKMKVAKSSLNEIDESNEDIQAGIIKKKLARKKLQRDQKYWLGDD